MDVVKKETAVDARDLPDFEGITTIVRTHNEATRGTRILCTGEE